MNSPKTFHCFQRGFALCGGTEELYPIHLAAKLGKPQLVKLLLREGVDRTKETSKGRVEEARNMSSFFLNHVECIYNTIDAASFNPSALIVVHD